MQIGICFVFWLHPFLIVYSLPLLFSFTLYLEIGELEIRGPSRFWPMLNVVSTRLVCCNMRDTGGYQRKMPIWVLVNCKLILCCFLNGISHSGLRLNFMIGSGRSINLFVRFLLLRRTCCRRNSHEREQVDMPFRNGIMVSLAVVHED